MGPAVAEPKKYYTDIFMAKKSGALLSLQWQTKRLSPESQHHCQYQWRCDVVDIDILISYVWGPTLEPRS